MTVAKFPNSYRVAALAAVELDAGATVDEEDEVDEVLVPAAELVEAEAVEEVLLTRLEDPTSGVLAGAETEEEAPTGEEPEGTGVVADRGVLTGTGVEVRATEATEDEAAAQVESAVSLTLTHWVTASLSVV